MSKPFLDWYAEEFDSGAVNEDNYRECAAFLAGFLAAHGDDKDGNLARCISLLRGGANLIAYMQREQMPSWR